MKYIILLTLCMVLYGDNLKSLLVFASKNNKIIKSKQYIQISKQKQLQSSKNSYYPTVHIGGSYQRMDNRVPMRPGDVYTGYIGAGIDLYDGGRRANIIKQNSALLKSAKYDTSLYSKNLQLIITRDYFTILSTKQTLKALKEKNIQLKAEVSRMKKFFKVGSVTIESVDKLRAALSNNIYLIDATKYQIYSLKKLLSLRVGRKIGVLKNIDITVPLNTEKSLSDQINILKEDAKSLKFAAKSIGSYYKPQIRLEDTFSLYGYGRYDTLHPRGLDNQNNLMLSFNINIFDNSVILKQKESLLAQKMAMQEQINQLKNEQNINIRLASSKINTIKAQIKSAKSFLIAAESVYKNIYKKFNAGSVDNVTYLDALSVQTNAKAQYEKALNDLQIAYATYYYYTNNDIKDFIK